jgi:hypothetical protein
LPLSHVTHTRDDQENTSASLASFLNQRALWYIVALFVFVHGLIRAFPRCFSSRIGSLDFPLQIISAQRILKGERPYRDFQTLYGPLGHYIAAVLQWPLRHLLPILAFEWYVYISFALFFAIVCVRFGRLRLARPLFLIGSIFLLKNVASILASFAYYSLAMTLPVIAVVILLPYTALGSSSKRDWSSLVQILVGILIAAELVIRINFGAYLVVAIAITGLFAYLRKDRPVAVAASRCLVFTALAACAWIGIFIAAGIALPAVADTHQFVARFAAARGKPWRYNPDHVLFKYTFLAVAVMLTGAVWRIRKRQLGFWLMPYLLLCAFFLYSFLRFDLEHIQPLLMISLLLLFNHSDNVTTEQSASSSPKVRWIGLLEFQVLALLLIPRQLGLPLLPPALKRLVSHAPASTTATPTRPVDVQSVLRHGVLIPPDEAAMLDRLDQMRKPEEEIFWASAPGSCQSSFDWCLDLNLYLADGILPKQKVWFFDTASTPFDDTQRSIVLGLESAKTPWVGVQDVYVRDTRLVAHLEAHILQDFILNHYNLAFTSEDPQDNRRFSVYVRKP